MVIAVAVAVIAGVVFIMVQARGAHPMVPLTLFESRGIAISVMIGFTFMVGYYGIPFLYSLYFQQI